MAYYLTGDASSPLVSTPLRTPSFSTLILVPIVGNPIHVEKCEKPAIEEVRRIQTLYIEELLR